MKIYVVELLNSNKADYNFVSIHTDKKEALAKASRFGAVVSEWENVDKRMRYVHMYNSDGTPVEES